MCQPNIFDRPWKYKQAFYNAAENVYYFGYISSAARLSEVCVKENRSVIHWLIVIDFDEVFFYFPVKTKSFILALIKNLIEYGQTSHLVVYGRCTACHIL